MPSFSKPAFVRDVGGTLSYDVTTSGTITAATVTIYDETGSEAVASASATVSGSTLSTTLAGATVDTLGPNWRAAWTYTIGGTVYRRQQTFSVVRAVLEPTLTTTRLKSYWLRILSGRFAVGASTFDNELLVGWERVLGIIRASGKDPHRIIDAQPLEEGHARLTAAIIASNYAAGNAATNEWQAWAEQQRRDGEESILRVLSACAWYDADDDLAPSGVEQGFPGTFVLTR